MTVWLIGGIDSDAVRTLRGEVAFGAQRRAFGDFDRDAALILGHRAGEVPGRQRNDQVAGLRGQTSRGGQFCARFVISAGARCCLARDSFFDPFDHVRHGRRIGQQVIARVQLEVVFDAQLAPVVVQFHVRSHRHELVLEAMVVVDGNRDRFRAELLFFEDLFDSQDVLPRPDSKDCPLFESSSNFLSWNSRSVWIAHSDSAFMPSLMPVEVDELERLNSGGRGFQRVGRIQADQTVEREP